MLQNIHLYPAIGGHSLFTLLIMCGMALRCSLCWKWKLVALIRLSVSLLMCELVLRCSSVGSGNWWP